MKILVTGGCGFIGSHIVLKLLENNHSVIILDNLSTGDIENIRTLNIDNVDLNIGDIRDKELLEWLIKDCDVVCHQAAKISVSESFNKILEYRDVNINSTLELLRLCSKYNKKVILASSSAVNYMTSPYAYSKKMNEDFAYHFNKMYGLDVTCLRYYNVFGERQRCEGDGAVIPMFIKGILNDKTVTIYGNGEQRRDFIYVDEIADYNVKIIEGKNENKDIVQHLGRGTSYSLLEILTLLEHIHQKRFTVIFKDERPGDILDSKSPVINRFHQVCDFFEELKQTYNYYKN